MPRSRGWSATHILPDARPHPPWVVEGPKGAALLLGLHPNTLRSRMKKLGIVRLAPTILAPPRRTGGRPAAPRPNLRNSSTSHAGCPGPGIAPWPGRRRAHVLRIPYSHRVGEEWIVRAEGRLAGRRAQ